MATLLEHSGFSYCCRTSNNNANRQANTNKRGRFCTSHFTSKLPPPRPVCHPWKQDQGNSATTLISRQRPSTFVVPMLAALLVGTGQPAAPALVYTGTVTVSDTDGVEKQPGEEAYLKLLQKIKERRERNQTAPAPGYTTNERTQQPREGAEKTDREGEAAGWNSTNNKLQKYIAPKFDPAEMRQVERPKPPEKFAPAKVEPPKAETVSEGKSKTHGFMPLFLAQILLFLATSGGTATLLLVDNNEWNRSEKAIEEYLEKARPVAEDVYDKVKPVSEQAWKMGQEFATEAKPYVEKAWKVTKPVALKTYESSKPLFRQAQEKLAKLFEQAQQRVKS